MLRNAVAISVTVMLAALFTACGSGSTGPSYPALGGSYASTSTLTFSNAAAIQNGALSGSLTITLSSADSHGNFTGSYVYGGGATGSGPIAGTERSDGGITITQFGSANVYEDLQYLQNAWPNCDFSQAASSGESGQIAGSTLSFGGTLDFPCAYQVQGGGIEDFSTTLTINFTGTRS